MMARSRETKPAALNIAFWNANGLLGKRNDLEVFAVEHNLDVVLVSETHLVAGEEPKLRNFDFYRHDRPGTQARSRGGGTGIYVRRSLDHVEIDTPPLVSMEACSVIINTADGPLRMSSVYKPPSRKLDPKDLEALLAFGGPTVLAGDFNSKHPTWNSRSTNTSGRALREFTDREGLAVVGPIEPTHCNLMTNARYDADVLDICVLKDVTRVYDVFTVVDMNSDHNPVLLTLNGVADNRPPVVRTRVHWPTFVDHVEDNVSYDAPISDVNQLEDAVEGFTGLITAAIKSATLTRTTSVAERPLPAEIRDLIRERNRARREWQRYRDPSDKTVMNRLALKVKRALINHRDD